MKNIFLFVMIFVAFSCQDEIVEKPVTFDLVQKSLVYKQLVDAESNTMRILIGQEADIDAYRELINYEKTKDQSFNNCELELDKLADIYGAEAYHNALCLKKELLVRLIEDYGLSNHPEILQDVLGVLGEQYKEYLNSDS